MSAKPKRLTFGSFSSVTLPGGTFLFFPEWHAKPEQPSPDSSQKVTSLVIQVGNRRKRQHGAVVGSTLFVVLDKVRFRRLAAELRRRPLGDKPVSFDFELDERGVLRELRSDGEELCGQQAHDSYVAGLHPGKGKAAGK